MADASKRQKIPECPRDESIDACRAATLDVALQKVGFKPLEPETVSYQMELKAEDGSAKRNTQ